jgi:hypothetical protein
VAYEIPAEKSRAISAALERVANQAKEPGRAWTHSPSREDERVIQRGVDRLLYEPLVPHGEKQEEWMVERFKQLARNGVPGAWKMAEAFGSVVGYGYIRFPLEPSNKEARKEHEWHVAQMEAAQLAGRRDLAWFHRECLLGTPARVMDFKIECTYLLRKPDGTVDRLVRLRNVNGETTGLVSMKPEQFVSPESFRLFGLSLGHFNFGVGARAGVQELNKIQHDVARWTAWQVVTQVAEIGWHELDQAEAADGKRAGLLKGIWFFRDGAVLPDGTIAEPDRHGIVWHEEEGFQLAQQGVEGKFAQENDPLLQPQRKVQDLRWRPEGVETWAGKSEEEILRAFFRETSQRLQETLGGYEGWFALGAMLSYAAAPEIFREHGAYPGLWLHGLANSGKSKLSGWLMHLWGFNLVQGLNVRDKNLSVVGMQIAADQYSNLPVWFDEYRRAEVPDDKLSVLQNAFNRGGGYKKINLVGGRQRMYRTAFLVSGESTTTDAAARGRYMHVQVSARKRQGEHLTWFNEHCHGFFHFGRYVLQNRARYVEAVMRHLEAWMGSTALARVDMRQRLVNGVGYAGWTAMMELLESHTPEEAQGFIGFAREHTALSAEDVESESNTNLFWDMLLTTFGAEEIPPHHFRYEEACLAHPPGAPQQGQDSFGQELPWLSYQLHFDPDAVLACMKVYLSRQREGMPLSRKDLRDQLSREPYWIGGKLRKRFGPGMAVKACWGIELDRHPLGYHRVTDQEFFDWVGLGLEARAERGDPRKGPLFGIIEVLKRQQTTSD